MLGESFAWRVRCLCVTSSPAGCLCIKGCRQCMQAAAQQTQEAHPNAQNAANARQWISAWRSKVACKHDASQNWPARTTLHACGRFQMHKLPTARQMAPRQLGPLHQTRQGKRLRQKLPGRCHQKPSLPPNQNHSATLISMWRHVTFICLCPVSALVSTNSVWQIGHDCYV